jgi:hypothetical protein
MRDVDERLAWFLGNRPAAVNRCAEYTWHALGGPTDPPRQGLPNATSVARLVQKLGHMRQGPCPRGAIRYWVGGANGDGHVGLEHALLTAPAAVASTDVLGPRTVGVKPLAWFRTYWPSLQYVGWSWYWGKFDTEPAAVEVDPEEPPDPPGIEAGTGLWKWYTGKPKTPQKVYPDGNWQYLPGLDEPASGIVGGSEKRLLYLRVELTPTRTADRVLETKFVRAGGDATAYDSQEFGTVKDSYPYNNVHFEDGDGRGGQWWVKVTGGKDPITLTTRYAKCHTIHVE